jgi:hypothetical protein
VQPAEPDQEDATAPGLLDAVAAGAVLAAAVAGWPLYSLVTAGSLDGATALFRGAVVAGACAVGVLLVLRLARGYEEAATAARQARLDALYTDMSDAVSSGTLTADGPDRPAGPDPTDVADGPGGAAV